MKYTQVTLPLFLILSSCSQSIIAHGELAKFHVDRAEAGNCAKAKRIANIFAPTYEDIVENFGSDEKVTVHIPVAADKKVEFTQKSLAKMVLVGADFIKKTQEHMRHHHLHNAALLAAKSVMYEVVKDNVIGFAIDKAGSQIVVPAHIKNNKLFAATGYVAGKAAGFALSVAYEAGINHVFGPKK